MDEQKVLTTVHDLIQDRIHRGIEVQQKLLVDPTFFGSVSLVAQKMVSSLRAGGTIFFFGNGGSAADAQHLAAEFTGRYLKDRRPLPAMALSVNTSALTAIGNDYGFDVVFARQLEAFGKRGDVAVGITTSGQSPNVVRALEVAKSKTIFAVVLTCASGGAAGEIADCAIRIPSDDTPRIQECHILAGHIICEIVERTLFSENGSGGPANTATLQQLEPVEDGS